MKENDFDDPRWHKVASMTKDPRKTWLDYVEKQCEDQNADDRADAIQSSIYKNDFTAYRKLGKSQNQTSGPKISPRRSRQESKVQRIRQRARQAGTDDIVPGNRLQNKFFVVI